MHSTFTKASRDLRNRRAKRRARAKLMEAIGAGAVVAAYGVAIVMCGAMLIMSASHTADAWAARAIAPVVAGL